jgi:hypothetical protein
VCRVVIDLDLWLVSFSAALHDQHAVLPEATHAIRVIDRMVEFHLTDAPAFPSASIGTVKSLLVSRVFTNNRLPSTEMPSRTLPLGPNPPLPAQTCS